MVEAVLYKATGTTWHKRYRPVLHEFRYPVSYYLFDIDSLSPLNRWFPLFGFNRRAWVAFHEADYLMRGAQTLRAKVLEVLQQRGIVDTIGSIELLTGMRQGNYIFNPVSFYYCYDTNHALVAYIVEINNTFKDKHVYVFRATDLNVRGEVTVGKEFHVSPFNNMEGDYKYTFKQTVDSRTVVIDLHRDGALVFTAGVAVKLSPLDVTGLAVSLIRHPFIAWLTMPRILWQAGKLYYRRKLGVYTRPTPSSVHSLRTAGPSLTESVAKRLVMSVLRRMQYGTVVLELADGTSEIVRGQRDPSPRLAVRIKNFRAFSRIALHGDIGVGEAYTEGEWEADDLVDLLRLFIRNQAVLDFRKSAFAWVGRALNRVFHVRNRNDLDGSQKNISEHYDLSNDFFSLFLDESLTYSSALFCDESASLHDAQINKLRSIIAKARLTPEDRVLEIGCGWGSFAIQAATDIGCTVTCLTLSSEQKTLAEQRVKAAGLDHKITILLQDYRTATGEYDKIVSIEMLEAVGKEFIPEYFSSCARLLKPNGLAVYQVITIPEQRIKRYAKGCDWIQKHIFPGCYCPAMIDLVGAAAGSDLVLEYADNIAPHYARTLSIWRERCYAKKNDIIALGFDEKFFRAWEYYLAYCEAGFASRVLGTYQLVFSRQHNASLGERVEAGDYSGVRKAHEDRRVV
jgi:cyclopropane-fatty-acyl-phospholipid synthase